MCQLPEQYFSIRDQNIKQGAELLKLTVNGIHLVPNRMVFWGEVNDAKSFS